MAGNPLHIYLLHGNMNNYGRRLCEQRYETRMSNFVMQLDDEAFRKTFRVTRHIFQLILNELKDHISVGLTKYSITAECKVRTLIICSSITAESFSTNDAMYNCFQLLVTLRFLAQGSYQLGVGNDTNVLVAQSTVSKILQEMIDVFNNVLCRQYIKFPNEAEMNDIAKWWVFL